MLYYRDSIRLTPPIQALAAFDIFKAEGGHPASLAPFSEKARVLREGLTRLGLIPLLPRERQGPILVNMLQPRDPVWELQRFVDLLKRRGFLISNFSTNRTAGRAPGRD